MVDWLAKTFDNIQYDPKFKELSKDTILAVVNKRQKVKEVVDEPPADEGLAWGWFGF